MNYARLKKIIPKIPGLFSTHRDNLRVDTTAHLPRRGPLVVVWDINNRCDAKCVYCDYWKNKNNVLDRELNKDQKLEIISKLGRAKVQLLSFSKGEPLLSSDLFDLVVAAKRHGMLVNVSTNGSLLLEKAQRLVEANLDFLTVSIESHLARIHDQIRAYHGLLKKIEKGIAVVKQIKGRSRPYIIIRKLIDRKTIYSLQEFLNYWGGRVDEIIFKPITDNARAFYRIPREMSFEPEDEGRVRKYFSAILKKNRTLNCVYNREIPTHLFAASSLNSKYRCFAGTFFCNIDYRGHVYPCIEGTTSVGDLKRDDLLEIWRSSKMSEFRQEFKNYRDCRCWSDRFMLNVPIQQNLNLTKFTII